VQLLCFIAFAAVAFLRLAHRLETTKHARSLFPGRSGRSSRGRLCFLPRIKVTWNLDRIEELPLSTLCSCHQRIPPAVDETV
jgi:hypothetical protein